MPEWLYNLVVPLVNIGELFSIRNCQFSSSLDPLVSDLHKLSLSDSFEKGDSSSHSSEDSSINLSAVLAEVHEKHHW